MANEVRIRITAKDDASATIAAAADRSGKAWASAANIIRTATIASGAAVAGLGVLSVTAASNLQEQQNKVTVVFRDQAKVILDWSRDSAKSFGLSSRAALEAAGTMGNLFVAQGQTAEASSVMSRKLVELAADLASFNNVNPDDALIALRSALVGEVEPMRKFGVALNAAAVEAEAMRLGLAKTKDEITEGAKTQARYSLILRNTTTAHGDFAATSDSMANRMRTLRAQFENTAATLGTLLLPTVEKAMGGIAKAMDRFSNWFTEHRQQIEQALAQIGDAIRNLALAFLRGMETIMPALRAFAEFLIANKPLLVAAIVAIGVAIVLALGPGTAAVAAIAAIIVGIGFMRDHWREVANAIIGIVEGMVNGIISGLNKATDRIGDFVEMVLKPFIESANKIPGISLSVPQIGAGGVIPGLSIPRVGVEASDGFDLPEEAITGVYTPPVTADRGTRAGADGGAVGGGGTAAREAFRLTDEGLARIAAITSTFERFNPVLDLSTAGMTELGRSFDLAQARYTDMSRSLDREMAQLGLSMADAKNAGGENTEGFKAMSARMDDLRASAERVDLLEQLNLDPWRKMVEEAGVALAALTEAEKVRAQATRDLIRDQHAATLAAQLADAKQELLILRLKSAT